MKYRIPSVILLICILLTFSRPAYADPTQCISLTAFCELCTKRIADICTSYDIENPLVIQDGEIVYSPFSKQYMAYNSICTMYISPDDFTVSGITIRMTRSGDLDASHHEPSMIYSLAALSALEFSDETDMEMQRYKTSAIGMSEAILRSILSAAQERLYDSSYTERSEIRVRSCNYDYYVSRHREAGLDIVELTARKR